MRTFFREAQKGPRACLRALLELPHRYPFAVSGLSAGLVIVAVFLAPGGFLAQKRAIEVQRTQITRIDGSLCGVRALDRGSLAATLCAARIRIAVTACARDGRCRQALKGQPVEAAKLRSEIQAARRQERQR